MFNTFCRLIAFGSATERVAGDATDFYSDHSFLSSGAVDSFGNAEAVSNRCIASVAATAGPATNTDISFSGKYPHCTSTDLANAKQVN